MDKRNIQMQRNKISQLVRMSNRCGSHVNCCRIIKGNSYEHEKAKFDICWAEINADKEVMTEVIFETGGKADVLVLDDALIYEVLKTEELKDCVEKIKKYPAGLSVGFVKVKA